MADSFFGFIGSGIIAEVFMERLLKAGLATPERVIGADVNSQRLQELEARFGIRVSPNNADAVRFADIVFVAVPPPVVLDVLREIAPVAGLGKIFISLAAAVPTWAMEQALARDVALVRVIPNTPSLIGAGMNPHCFGSSISDTDRQRVRRLLEVFGETIEVAEDDMNTASALTAVGPTYVFPVIAALIRAACARGLTLADARIAAVETVLGAANLVKQTGRAPDDLKLMIGTRTIDEAEVGRIFTAALDSAADKIRAAERKITSPLANHVLS